MMIDKATIFQHTFMIIIATERQYCYY